MVFCALVVGSVDNLLRPILVGKDTQMHELMIFFGTLGGIFMFGVVGVIIGPIIAALFVTVWEIYGQAFKDILPDTGYVLRKRDGQAESESQIGGEAKSPEVQACDVSDAVSERRDNKKQ